MVCFEGVWEKTKHRRNKGTALVSEESKKKHSARRKEGLPWSFLQL
jgi:hypothetical protein